MYWPPTVGAHTLVKKRQNSIQTSHKGSTSLISSKNHPWVGNQYIRKIYFFSKFSRGALFFATPLYIYVYIYIYIYI